MKILSHTLVLLILGNLLSCEKKASSNEVNIMPQERVNTTPTKKYQKLRTTQKVSISKEERIKAFMKSLDSMSAEELTLLINEPTSEQQKILRSHEIVAEIFRKLGRLDPEKAFELSSQMPSLYRVIATHYLFISWGEIDFEKATETANSLTNKNLIHQAINGSIIGLVSTDPDKAYQMVTERDDLIFLNKFFRAWSESDPLAAYAKTEELNDSRIKKAMVSSIVDELVSKKDTKGILELLNTSSNSDDRLVLLKGLKTNWHALDPDVITYVESVTDPKEKELAKKILATQRIYSDPALVAGELLKRLANIDSEDKSMTDNIPALMTAYSKKDKEETRAFFEKLPEGSEKDQAYPYYLAVLDPDIAMQHILDHENIGHLRNQYHLIGELLMDENVQTRIEQALNSDSKNADFLVESMYNSWPVYDLPAASKYLESIDHTFKNIGRLYGKVAVGYAHKPVEGAAWIEGIADEKNRNKATESFVDTWVWTDLDSAVDWVNTLETSSQRSVAVKTLATSLQNNGDTDLAVEWASTISDDSVKAKTLKDLFYNWNMQSSNDAKAWLEETDLITNEAKKKIKDNPSYSHDWTK